MIPRHEPGHAYFYTLLERCCQLVSEAYGKPDRTEWTNGDYVNLSETLFRQTKVRIGLNTLKRIFGKLKTDARYYPQQATRDALAVYIGYTNWDQFVEAQSPSLPLEPSPAVLDASPVEVSSSAATAFPFQRLFWLAGLVVAGLIAGSWLLKNAGGWFGEKAPVRLVCKNPLGNTPHSAIFALTGAKATLTQPYDLDFGDGKRARINSDSQVVIHYYDRPGRYYAVLKAGNQNVDTATVYLPTRGWTSTAKAVHDTLRVYPINVPSLFDRGQLHIRATDVNRAGVDTLRPFFTEFDNAQATTLDGDNFELLTHVTSSAERPGIRCSQVRVIVWGQSAMHLFDVQMPGCDYWNDLQFSEQVKTGMGGDDVRFLGANLRAGGTLTLRVIDRRVSLFINKRQVYSTRYNRPLGRIYGVRILFGSLGTVHSFSLRDIKTGKEFDGNF